jgi:hypothetical protein
MRALTDQELAFVAGAGNKPASDLSRRGSSLIAAIRRRRRARATRVRPTRTSAPSNGFTFYARGEGAASVALFLSERAPSRSGGSDYRC